MTEGASIDLHAWGICSKYGFHDGDILFDLRVDEHIDLKGIDEHLLLIRLVKDHLLVAMPFHVEIHDEYGTHHNPAQLKCKPEAQDELIDRINESNVFVTLSASDIQKTIDVMAAENEHASKGE